MRPSAALTSTAADMITGTGLGRLEVGVHSQASGGTEKHNWVATFGTPPPFAHDLWTREVSITGEHQVHSSRTLR